MKDGQPSAISGLGTDTFKVIAAGMYYLSAQTTVNIPSGLVITLSQSGSVSASITTPTTSAQQESLAINKTFNCQIGDLLSVVTSSSAPLDQPPNLIKTIVNLRQMS